nr:immunoglobulin light chain junction region [Macaca mulatta]MOX85074.1 immunoglobulin light chain junction region [Macaca mulatta]MOX85335.1 immunoglobulin light chain junction region [Macaca mulatta]MOX85472.1 immunoglobulin light chain junction region [Macaca mulatta]MOX85733.1 immunoglobulin light chain junction region [Macaca mulatta]
CQQGDSNPFTF